jgi:hypothetical protein
MALTLADALRQTGYAQDGQLQTPAPTQPNLSTMAGNYISQIPQKINENQANQMALLEKALPSNGTFENMMLNGDPNATAELAMQIPTAGMMIGPQSALWNEANAFKAAKMLKQGIPEDEVYKITGTAKGLDNAFRQELSDEKALIKGGGKFGDIYEQRKTAYGVTTPTVEEVMRHPELFESYPQLKGIQVHLLPTTSKNNASYSPMEGIIRVNPNLTDKQAISSMLHELQHGVQEIEGFNKGTDAAFILKNLQNKQDEIEGRLIEANRAASKAVGTDAYDALMKARDKIGQEYRNLVGTDIRGILGKAMDEYKAYGGEAEARLTQTRQKLTDEQRRNIYPFAKGNNALDINPNDAIIQMEHNSPILTRKQLMQQQIDKIE